MLVSISTTVTLFLQETGSGFLVGDGVTWVDVLIANAVEDIECREQGFLAVYPEVEKLILFCYKCIYFQVVQHQKMIHAIPSLKKWMETRPSVESR